MVIQAQGYKRLPQLALRVTDVEGLEEVRGHGKTSLWLGVAVDAAKHGKFAVVIGIKRSSAGRQRCWAEEAACAAHRH